MGPRPSTWLLPGAALALAALVAAGATPALTLDPAAFPEPMRAVWWERRGVLLVHMACAVPALLLGPFLMLAPLRARFPRVHAALGHVYAGLSCVGALAGLSMALTAFGGPAARLGFVGMGLAWLVPTAIGWQRGLEGDRRQHGRWMVRSYAACFGAVTLRLQLLAATLAGLPYAEVYPWVAWLCWVPNLLLLEAVQLHAPVVSGFPRGLATLRRAAGLASFEPPGSH